MSSRTNRNLEDIESEINHSIGMLDRILGSLEQEGEKSQKLMKNYSIPSARHEDIQRSLEVLDSVLAEFDDCIDTLESPRHKHFKSTSKQNTHFEETTWKEIRTSREASGTNLYHSTGDSSSHNISNLSQEQVPISPPPIPKRSPTTRLSERIQSHFTFQSDVTSEDSYDSFRFSSFSDNSAALSTAELVEQQIRPLSPAENDDVFCDIPNEREDDNCANCGRTLTLYHKMEIGSSGSEGTSPFLPRRHDSERSETFQNGKSLQSPKLHLNVKQTSSPVLPFKSRMSPSKTCENCSNSTSSRCVDNGSSSYNSSCTCEERIRQLNKKFQRVRDLMRQNKIKILDNDPPSFVPSPPSSSSEVSLNACYHISPKNTSSGPALNAELDYMISGNEVSSNCSQSKCTSSVSHDTNQINYPSCQDTVNYSCTNLRDSSNHCSSYSLSYRLSPTAEDIPNLLPTDVLIRPQLGMSYSLEDDMSPGVKEICKTSTPRSDVSSSSLFKAKESGLLSTFSSSASSLGYVSSQSELELNNLSDIPDKVPVSSFKSLTLPNGLDRFPYYSSSQDTSNVLKRYNSQKAPDSSRDTEERKHQSYMDRGSVPNQKPKKKESHFHFRGFSRKEKKEKKTVPKTSS